VRRAVTRCPHAGEIRRLALALRGPHHCLKINCTASAMSSMTIRCSRWVHHRMYLNGTVNLGGSAAAGMIGGSVGRALRGLGWWHRCAIIQGVPVSGGDHQSLCLAVLPFPAQLPRGRGDDVVARDRGLPRNHPPVVRKVRPDLRQRATSSPGTSREQVAPRRGVHQNQRQDPLLVTGGGPARDRARHPGHLPARRKAATRLFPQAAHRPGVPAQGAASSTWRSLLWMG
jgi:hypothetical protein